MKFTLFLWMKQKNTKHAKRLRQDQTRSETVLWSRLRNRRLEGWKFRRQVPRENYVVDFFCAQAGLIVELDGGIHHLHSEKDEARDNALKRAGYQVLRFQNRDVFDDMEGVLKKILEYLSAPSP